MRIREAILFWIVLGFAGGVAVDELTHESWIIFIVILIAGLLSAVYLAVFTKKIIPLLILIVACSACGGFLRSHVALYFAGQKTELDQYVGEKVTLLGVLGEEQERRDFNTRLSLGVREVKGQKIGHEIKVLVTTANPTDFHYGDIVRVTGELVKPENFYTDTGREFDYVGYLETSGIHFLVRDASVSVLGHDPPNKILAGLFFAKRKFVGSLTQMLPEPQSSLAAGILIDGKQSINGELQEKFRKTGLVHIVVLSGYNVSIVAEVISKAFSFLPRMLGMFGASLGIIAFALITGASATVIRASIMALIVILSRMSLRNYDPARGLFIASFLMLVHNPAILLHSPSFQLSFLATFCVVKVVPKFEKMFSFIPERFGLRDLVSSNIIVQTFLFPILTWMTGFFSAVSLPVNLLVLPLIPLTMFVSFLTAITGLLSRFVAYPFAFAAQSLLSYELLIVNYFSKFSLAEIAFGGFSGQMVAGFYIAMIVTFLFLKIKPKTK